MNVLIFGPPGIGKSTLIGRLKAGGAPAIDLEDIYPSKVRFTLPNVTNGVIYGAADLDPKQNYPNSVKVLLIADEAQYKRRRAMRDAKQPSKKNQSQHTIADWDPESNMWYSVVNANSLPQMETDVLKILASVRSKGGVKMG
jgi:hypothetical protein